MILSLGIWEEEDNIAIDRKIPCVIYTDITRTMLLSIAMLSSSSHIPRLRISHLHLCEFWAYYNGQNSGFCPKTVGGRSGKDLVNNKSLNNQKLTPISTMSLWVVPDIKSARKYRVEDWARVFRVIITVSTISNWNLPKLWDYYNGQEYGLCSMRTPWKNRGGR